MDPILFLIALTASAAVAILTLQVYGGFTYTRRAVRARLAPRGDIVSSGPGSVLRTRSRGGIPFLGALPFSPEATTRLQLQLQQAGWAVRPAEFVALRAACALVGAVGGSLLAARLGLDVAWLRLGGVAALTLGCWFAPSLLLERRRRSRLQLIEKQLPDALTSLAKAMRAGSGLLQALEYAANETQPPLGPELAEVMRDLRLGADAEEVFRDLSARVGSQDLDIATTGIVIQRTVGGNLSEILDHVTNTIRERAELQGEIRALTAQQRLGANFAAALPVLVAVAVSALRPDMAILLITTTIGNIALAIGIGFELLGIWMINRLAVIEV